MARQDLATRLAKAAASGRSVQVTAAEAGELLDSLSIMALVISRLRTNDWLCNVNPEALADAIASCLVITSPGIEVVIGHYNNGWCVFHRGSEVQGMGHTLLEAMDCWLRLCNLPPVSETTITIPGGVLYDQIQADIEAEQIARNDLS